MAATGVNLDAIIQRADLAVGEGMVSGVQGEERIGIAHLREREFFAKALRKPDFQRETQQWSPAKIVDLVAAFLDRQLVPAVILWRAADLNFVVDGAHRLSALLAWMYDDYGDGTRSQKMFGPHIPPEQDALAKKTRRLIEKHIGKFADLDAYTEHRGARDAQQLQRIRNLSATWVVAQWVPAATKDGAEDSFFKINGAATPLENTEKRILISRGSASAIASRAIAHGGKGHAYWGHFDGDRQISISEAGERIYGLLYKPPLADGPIDTLDVPVAGKGYSQLPFVFDLVNSVNDPRVKDSTSATAKDKLAKDEDGDKTVQYLSAVLDSVSRVTGKYSGSLGLHPVIYFYTKGGSFSPWAYLAWTRIIDDLWAAKRFNAFCDCRPELEKYLWADKWAMTEIIHKMGSGSRSTPVLLRYWQFVLELLLTGKTAAQVTKAVNSDPAWQFLAVKTPVIRPAGEAPKRRFGAKTATSAIWDAALPGAPRCVECNGYWHRNSFTNDHKSNLRDGGDARPSNLGIVHPYCNSAYKDFKAKAAS